MKKYLILMSLVTAIISGVIVIGVEFALYRALDAQSIITGAAVGLGSGVSIFLLYRNRKIEKCR